jgi:hypothetical protein
MSDTSVPSWAKNISDPKCRGYQLGRSDAITYRATRQREPDNLQFQAGYKLGYATMAEWFRLHDEWTTCNREFGTSDQDTRQAYYTWQTHNARTQVLDAEYGLLGK